MFWMQELGGVLRDLGDIADEDIDISIGTNAYRNPTYLLILEVISTSAP